MTSADGKLEGQLRHNAFLTAEQEIWLRAYCTSLSANYGYDRRHTIAKEDADRCLINFKHRFYGQDMPK